MIFEGPTGWILTLACAYAALGALLSVALIGLRMPWLIKAAAIVVVSAFYVGSFFGLRALPGYASDERLPPRFKLLGARIVEPKTIPGDPGSIYLWVEAMSESNVLSGAPRAFRLRYSDKMAGDVENAVRRSDQGHPQGGETGHGKEGEDWLGPNAGLSIDGGMALNGKEPETDAARDEGIVFTALPAPSLPTKDDQLTP